MDLYQRDEDAEDIRSALRSEIDTALASKTKAEEDLAVERGKVQSMLDQVEMAKKEVEEKKEEYRSEGAKNAIESFLSSAEFDHHRNRIIEEYAEPNVDTLHKKNLFSLGEDRFLTTLMMKHFPTPSPL